MAEPAMAAQRRSALQGFYHMGPVGPAAGAEPGVTLRQVVPETIWLLCGAAPAPPLQRGLAGGPGRQRVVGTAGAAFLPVGPGRWLVLSDEVPERLAEGVLDLFEAPQRFDLSHARVVIEVGGERAQELLSKGCPLDLARFGELRCAATLVGQVPAVLYRGREGTPYRFVVPRSYALSVWQWTLLAASDLRAEVLPAAPGLGPALGL